MLLQPPQVFSISGLRLYFPHAGTLGWAVCHLVHQLLPGWPAIALPTWLHDLPQCWVLLQLPPCRVSTVPCHQSLPPYRSGWMCFLYLLGCRTSIQFDFLSVMIVFIFKLLLSFFLLCEEAMLSTYTSILARIQKLGSEYHSPTSKHMHYCFMNGLLHQDIILRGINISNFKEKLRM